MKLFGIKIVKEVYMPIIIILSAIILNKIAKIIINKIFNPKRKYSKLDKKKVNTISSILKSISKYIIWILAILYILSIFGVNTAAIITGLGVVSLVVGLAFQDILKDILVGISILFENQFSVGDYVKVGDFSGTVISIGLKTTRIQALTKEIKIISNRNISEVINYSSDNMLAVVDLSVSYESDIDKVEKIINVKAATLKDKIPDLSGDIRLLGVQKLDDSSVVFRVVAECLPAKHFDVERILNKEFKKALDKNGIKIPYPQLEVHNEK